MPGCADTISDASRRTGRNDAGSAPACPYSGSYRSQRSSLPDTRERLRVGLDAELEALRVREVEPGYENGDVVAGALTRQGGLDELCAERLGSRWKGARDLAKPAEALVERDARSLDETIRVEDDHRARLSSAELG